MGIKLEHVQEVLADHYIIERQLGRGGMASVYYALDLARDRQPIALKVLRPEFAVTLEGGRFHREISILSKLNHPHILPLMESGKTGVFLYYSMPYCAGGSLRTKMEEGSTLSLEDALEITRALTDALDYAHAQNVIHRDLKPGNILFDEGKPVLCDFGIARAMVAAGGDDISSSGLVVGTPDYMSPEQASGSSVIDGRTDIYSLACVIFEMLAGQPPFTGYSAQAIMARHVSEDPPSVQGLRPDLPDHVAAALRTALDKKPRRRPQRAAAFLRLLMGA